MRTNRIIVWFVTAVAALSSCTERESEVRHESGNYRISLQAAIEGTRSGSFRETITINDFNLYFFSEGSLEKQVFVQGSAETSVDLNRYGEYRIYAIANAGKVDVKDGILESNFKKSELEYSSLNSLNGIPCSYSAEDAIVPATDIGNGLSICLTPMFARFNLSLEVTGTAPGGKMSINDVSCFNINNRLTFFSGGSKATSVIRTGDFLSSDDIAKLCGGQAATFFVPENMQGTKASSGNKKGSGGVCTFLVINGTYESGMASYDLDYVLYLGKNNSTSFDIERGSTYEIVASIDLGDEHLLGITPAVLEDYSNPEQKAYVQPSVKYFQWLSESVTLKPGESASVYFETNLNSSDITFSLTGDKSISLGAIDWNSSCIQVSADAGTVKGASAQLTGGSSSVWDTMDIRTRTLTLMPSTSEMETWGGNSYPLTFKMVDSDNGETDVTSRVQCTSVSYNSSAPKGLLVWNSSEVEAADWWEQKGSWAGGPVEFTMTFSLDGMTTTVSGTMHGYTGMEFDRTDYWYSELERKEYKCDNGTVRLIGSETTDISSLVTICPNGDYMWDTNNGPSCVRVGNDIPAAVVFTDPSNKMRREVPISLSVTSDVAQLYVYIKPSIRNGNVSGQPATVEATKTKSGEYLGSAGIRYINYGEQASYDMAIIQSIYYIDKEGNRIDLTGSNGVESRYVRVETSIGSLNDSHEEYPDTEDWQMMTNLSRDVARGQHDMIYLWVNGFSASWQWEIVN